VLYYTETVTSCTGSCTNRQVDPDKALLSAVSKKPLWSTPQKDTPHQDEEVCLASIRVFHHRLGSERARGNRIGVEVP
jgi:hypothetical protein